MIFVISSRSRHSLPGRAVLPLAVALLPSPRRSGTAPRSSSDRRARRASARSSAARSCARRPAAASGPRIAPPSWRTPAVAAISFSLACAARISVSSVMKVDWTHEARLASTESVEQLPRQPPRGTFGPPRRWAGLPPAASRRPRYPERGRAPPPKCGESDPRASVSSRPPGRSDEVDSHEAAGYRRSLGQGSGSPDSGIPITSVDEVDEAPLDVGRDQLDAQPVADLRGPPIRGRACPRPADRRSRTQVPFSEAPVTTPSKRWPIRHSSSSAAADLRTCRSTLSASSSCSVQWRASGSRSAPA